jgi:hypothetical protein
VISNLGDGDSKSVGQWSGTCGGGRVDEEGAGGGVQDHEQVHCQASSAAVEGRCMTPCK